MDSIGVRSHTDLHWGKELAYFSAHNFRGLLHIPGSFRFTSEARVFTSSGLIAIGRHENL